MCSTAVNFSFGEKIFPISTSPSDFDTLDNINTNIQTCTINVDAPLVAAIRNMHQNIRHKAYTNASMQNN